MGFAAWRSFGLGLIVLLWGSIAGGMTTRETPEIEVLVYDNGTIASSMLEQAENEAARILHGAGLDVIWINCPGSPSEEEACHSVPGDGQFVLHVVPSARVGRESVFGEAFLGEDGAGKYGDIFFDRIEKAHLRLGLAASRLLGGVVAHELGHLLLGPNAHSLFGIMSPRWETDNVRQMEMGSLFFTSDQAMRIKARVEREPGRGSK